MDEIKLHIEREVLERIDALAAEREVEGRPMTREEMVEALVKAGVEELGHIPPSSATMIRLTRLGRGAEDER